MVTKKTIIAIILVVLFLINIIAAAFIFIDIQVLAFPQTTLQVDVIEINTDEIIIHHNFQLYNPNSFEMILQDFQIVAKTTEGEEVANMTIDGGSIPGQTHQNYSAKRHHRHERKSLRTPQQYRNRDCRFQHLWYHYKNNTT